MGGGKGEKRRRGDAFPLSEEFQVLPEAFRGGPAFRSLPEFRVDSVEAAPAVVKQKSAFHGQTLVEQGCTFARCSGSVASSACCQANKGLREGLSCHRD